MRLKLINIIFDTFDCLVYGWLCFYLLCKETQKHCNEDKNHVEVNNYWLKKENLV